MTGGEYFLAILLFIIGILIAIGKVLVNDQPYNYKTIIGKAILNGMTSLMAGMLLLTFTSASPLVILGFGAFLGTLGTEASLAWIKNKFGGGGL